MGKQSEQSKTIQRIEAIISVNRVAIKNPRLMSLHVPQPTYSIYDFGYTLLQRCQDLIGIMQCIHQSAQLPQGDGG